MLDNMGICKMASSEWSDEEENRKLGKREDWGFYVALSWEKKKKCAHEQ